ncbi:MAG: hypothetical protein QOF51_85 [Chloroflexota bacterium]|jgi:hypothetical protein|nr:hypothetical protein [Chloroflexota bacterium]
MLQELEATSWAELHDLLFAESWSPALGRFRSPFAFRGVADARYSLVTSLLRLGPNHRRLEGHLLRNFRKYARSDAGPGDSIWNWLALAQHHGLPTRMLDWTYSPYVALHFATADTASFAIDGVIWCVDYVQTHGLLPDALRAILAEEESDVFTAEMLDRAAGTLRGFQALATSDILVFFEPPSFDDRIVNQAALFSLVSRPGAAVEEWLAQHPVTVRKIVIPAALKWEVRDKLDQANVTERVLFPGLDGLTRWLSRYYSPRPFPVPGPDLD